MSWNYRVIEHEDEDVKFYQIHEVYYDKDGNPESMTEDASLPFGDNVEELNHTLIYMISALTKPVLPYTMFDEEHDKDVKKTIDKTLGLLNVRPKD